MHVFRVVTHIRLIPFHRCRMCQWLIQKLFFMKGEAVGRHFAPSFRVITHRSLSTYLLTHFYLALTGCVCPVYASRHLFVAVCSVHCPNCSFLKTSSKNLRQCFQWLKWFCEAGRLTRRSQVGANPIPIPTPLIWRYLGIK